MRLRTKPSFARQIAVVLVSAGIPALAFGSGCLSHPSPYPASSEAPNGPSHDGGVSTVEGGTVPEVDLCACARVLDTTECYGCIKKAIDTGGSCVGVQSACQGDSECAKDTMCVGACIHTDASDQEPACVNACLAAATMHYVAYLKCICQHCDECEGDVPCSGP